MRKFASIFSFGLNVNVFTSLLFLARTPGHQIHLISSSKHWGCT